MSDHLDALAWDASLAVARESERVERERREWQKRGEMNLLRRQGKERAKESGSAWQARLARYAEGVYGDDGKLPPEILTALFGEGGEL